METERKYRKYKGKYLHLKRRMERMERDRPADEPTKEEFDDELHNMFGLNKERRLEKGELDRVVSRIASRVEKCKDNICNEGLHMLEDTIMRMFVRDVVDGSLTPEESREIGRIVKRLTDLDYVRWYA